MCFVSFTTTDSPSGTLQRCSFYCAPKYGVIFSTDLNLTSTKTQNFIPYLSGLLGMKIIKEQRDFRGMTCSSTVRRKLHVHLDWHMEVKVLKTSRIGENLSDAEPLLILVFGLSSNCKYFNIFVNLFRGIILKKRGSPYLLFYKNETE